MTMLPAASISCASSTRRLAPTAAMRSPSTRTSPVARLGTVESIVTTAAPLKRVRPFFCVFIGQVLCGWRSGALALLLRQRLGLSALLLHFSLFKDKRRLYDLP